MKDECIFLVAKDERWVKDGERCIFMFIFFHLYSLSICFPYHLWFGCTRPRGLMDKASDFGSEDCEFESRRGQNGKFSSSFHIV